MAAGDPLRTLEAVASTRLPLNEAVFDWCLRNARGCLARGALGPTLRWSLLAARSAIHHGFGWLASPELERILLVAASQLPCRMAGRAPRSGPVRWLHVMDEAHPIGGHSALVRRWMELDPHGSRHSVMILSQRGAVEPRLADAVRVADGVVRMLDPDASLMERARRPSGKNFWSHADRVVLHVHPWSVVPVVALGLPGGPPVMLLNHLSQQFWVGGSVADTGAQPPRLGAGVEPGLRGIHRNTILPIPLPDATIRTRDPRAPARGPAVARTSGVRRRSPDHRQRVQVSCAAGHRLRRGRRRRPTGAPRCPPGGRRAAGQRTMGGRTERHRRARRDGRPTARLASLPRRRRCVPRGVPARLPDRAAGSRPRGNALRSRASVHPAAVLGRRCRAGGRGAAGGPR